MSWLFSQALVEEFLEANSSAGEPSAPSSGTPTPQAYCSPDKMTDFSRLSRFGMTFRPSTEIRGADLLTWCQEVSRVKTSAQQEKAQESMAHEAGCGDTWHASLAKYDRDSRSWKTRQCSLLAGLDEYSETWPKWGMMRAGECWEQNTPAQFTADIEYGFLPTPMLSDFNGGGWRIKSPRLQMTSLKYFAHAKYANRNWKTSHLIPEFVEIIMRFPSGWTGLKPLETLKFQAWQHSLSKP